MNPTPSQTDPRARGVIRVLVLTFLLNVLVCAAKLVVGVVVNSLSMVADGFHSMLDASSNVVGFVSVVVASKPADAEHPYGHKKFEVVAALIISFFMGMTCFEILKNAYSRLGQPASVPHPSPAAFGIMVGTIAINAWVSWYERKKGMEYQSPILTADSAHTGSDILSSCSVLAALVAAKMGWAWADLAGSLLIVAVILWVAYSILAESLHILSDRIILDPEVVVKVVQAIPGIVSCHKVRSRGMAGNIFVDLHIQVSPEMTTLESHALAHRVMAEVKKGIAGVAEVIVHTEPVKNAEKPG